MSFYHKNPSYARMEVGKADFTTEDGREVLIDALINSALCSAPGMMETDPCDLPRRYLPPGNFSDLYRLYTASCHSVNEPAASCSTFFRVLKTSGWRKKLRHRGKTTHAKCSTCHKLKNKIRKAKSLQEHAAAADDYLRHLAGQCADRRCYWEFRHRATIQQDLIVAIQDSMDKSKFSIPRYADGICPKALEQKVRPQCEVTACIVHGRGIFIYVADPDLSFGSDWSIEVFSRSLQTSWELGQQSGKPWPRTCKLFSDNTPKERLDGLNLCFCWWVWLFIAPEWLFMACTTLKGNQELLVRPLLLFFNSMSMLWQRGPWTFRSWTHSRGCRSQSQYLHPMQSDVCPLKCYVISGSSCFTLHHLASKMLFLASYLASSEKEMKTCFHLSFAWTTMKLCSHMHKNSCWTQPLCAPSVRQSPQDIVWQPVCTGWLDVTPTSHTCQCPLAETWCVHTISNMSGPTRGFWIQSWRSTSTRKTCFSRLAMWLSSGIGLATWSTSRPRVVPTGSVPKIHWKFLIPLHSWEGIAICMQTVNKWSYLAFDCNFEPSLVFGVPHPSSVLLCLRHTATTGGPG